MWLTLIVAGVIDRSKSGGLGMIKGSRKDCLTA